MSHKDTNLAFNKLYIDPKFKGTIDLNIKTGFQVYFLAVNSTELYIHLHVWNGFIAIQDLRNYYMNKVQRKLE